MECFAYFFYIRARNVKKIPVSKYFGFKTYSISGIFHIFSYIRAIRVNNTPFLEYFICKNIPVVEYSIFFPL